MCDVINIHVWLTLYVVLRVLSASLVIDPLFYR